jgi:glycosyltransferase involved in cell wall biosynthesis
MSADERLVGVAWDALPFSRHDRIGLPRLLAETRVDVFIALQFYTASELPCPHVRVIHDLWPLEQPALLAPWSFAEARFGHRELEDFLREATTGVDGSREAEVEESRRRGWRLIYHCYRLAVDSATAIMVPTGTVAARLGAWFPAAAAKTKPIYPLGRYFQGLRSRPMQAAVPDRVLHVGNWEPRKNQLALLRVLGLFREERPALSARLVGDRTSLHREYIAELTGRVAAAERQGWLADLGRVTDSQLWQAIRQAHVLVQPSLDEGFGLPAVEAMALGTPVISSSAGAIPEVCGGAAAIVDPHDQRLLLETLRQVLDDQTAYEELRSRGRDRATDLLARPHAQMFRDLLVEAASGSQGQSVFSTDH